MLTHYDQACTLIIRIYKVNLSIADMLLQLTPCCSGHFFVEPAESRSSSHRKTPIQRTLLQRIIVIADTIFWHHMKSSSQIYFFIADNPCGNIKIHCYSIFKCSYLTTFPLFTFSELSTFFKPFLSQVVTLGFP